MLRHIGGGVAPRAGRHAILTLVSLSAAPVLAQAVPPSVSVPTSQEIRRDAIEAPAPPRVSVNTNDSLTTGPCPEALKSSQAALDIARVDVTDANGAPLPEALASALQAAFVGKIGQRRIDAVCELRDIADQVLRERRYVAVTRVPEQTIVDGVLKLQVTTTRITELRVRGEVRHSSRRVQALLDELSKLSPLNERDAERILLAAFDIPGTTITLDLRRTGRTGEVIGEIAIEQQRFALFGSVNNYGSTQIGRVGGQLRAEYYGLTGLADRTVFSLFATSDFKEQKVAQIGHDFLPGLGSLRLGGNFTYAWTRPTLTGGAGLDLRSEAFVATIDARYPALRRLGATIDLAAGFDVIEQRTRSSNIPINIDKLRVFFARASGSIAERAPNNLAPAWALGGAVELRKGTGLFDASQTGASNGGAIPTRFEGDPQAFVARGEVSGTGRLRFGPQDHYAVSLTVTGRGQWADHPLLAFEEMAIGNLTIGRGYDPGANSADRAFGGTAELAIGKPRVFDARDKALEMFGFYDIVRIYNLDTGATENARSLASVGGGLRFTFGGLGRLEATYAHPLDKALSFDSKRAPARLLLTLTMKLLPW